MTSTDYNVNQRMAEYRERKKSAGFLYRNYYVDAETLRKLRALQSVHPDKNYSELIMLAVSRLHATANGELLP